MDKTQILDFLKKNVFALSCGGVAVAAVVATVYPFNGMLAALSEKATQEAGTYATLNGLQHARRYPTVDPTHPTAVDLTGFPNKEQVDAGKTAVARLAQESTQAMDRLVALNGDQTVHPPLVPQALPAPAVDTPKFQFADVYRRVLSLDPTTSGLGSPTVPPPVQANRQSPAPMAVDERLAAVHALNLANDILRAGAPADVKLVKDRQDWLRVNVYDPQLISDGSGAFVNQTDVQQRMTADFLLVPDRLNQEIAERARVYLDKDAFAVSPSLMSATTPQMPEIWFAQLSLWMQTDIARAVAAANAPAGGGAGTAAATAADAAPHGVAESPVKRIIRLDLRPIPMYQFAAANGGPAPVDETAVIPPTYAVSPTGRTSNKMYDVVPFRLTVDIEADHVNRFIATLTRDRLIYVYNQDLYSIDPAPLVSQGYRYGTKPVVRLTLSGEELFLRKWTVPLMPLRIKYLLAVEVPPPGSTIQPLGGGAAGQMPEPMSPAGMPGMPGMPGM